MSAVQTRPIAPRLSSSGKVPHIGPDLEAYHNAHRQTVGSGSDDWWSQMANDILHWHRPFKTVRTGGFENGDVCWFPEGGLNASYNCVDRWAAIHPDKTAIMYEADEPGEGYHISYARLLAEVCGVANILKSYGVKKGDTVTIYMPMTWRAIVACLACTRLGAVHSVVFAGFSAESLRDRILDCDSRVLITSDEGRRGGKTTIIKRIVDVALKECPQVKNVLVLKRTGGDVAWTQGRDHWWHEEIKRVPQYCAPEVVSSEDPLFILYTSGSTGKPKGVVHATGGYLLCAALSLKYVFDVHPEDKFGCVADIGWMTAHTYVMYGPLLLGMSTTVFESTPVYPTPSRYWQMVQQQGITQFYLAPTAIRLLRKMGAHYVDGYNLSTLRVLGSAGEPIDPESWEWYNQVVGRNQCAVVDTYWQTETGSPVITPFPGAVETKPGSATVPFFGIQVGILDSQTGQELEGPNVEGVLVLKTPWPSMARTIRGDHKRYLETYMRPYPGMFFTGDSASRDEHGYIWIKGRMDDVINVSGHRLSTSEIEGALILHKGVAETAVIGVPDEVTGQAVYAFVTLKPDFSFDPLREEQLVKELTLQVRSTIGPLAAPKKIYVVSDLPHTRSGKIMRRVIRKIVAGEGDQLGDLSTISEPTVVDILKQKVAGALRVIPRPIAVLG